MYQYSAIHNQKIVTDIIFCNIHNMQLNSSKET